MIMIKKEIDSKGNLTYEEHEDGSWTSYEYDDKGRVVKEVNYYSCNGRTETEFYSYKEEDKNE